MREANELVQARLLRLIAEKDKRALGELYDQMASPLFAVSVRILGDRLEAEEVIQDVFVEIWNKAAAFDESLGTAFHWTMSIVRNRSIDRIRLRKRRARIIERLEEFAPADFAEAAMQALPGLGLDEMACVHAAVNGLPDDQRRALEMAFFKGQTHTEIAESTGEPLGTVKARIRRGLLRLRSVLQEYA